jgi:hypothetical protein
VVYQPGIDNRVADALSRKSSHDLECFAMSAASPQWIQEVVMGYQAGHHAQSLISKLTVDSGAVPDFTLVNGLLRYKGIIRIGIILTFKRSYLLHAIVVLLGAIQAFQ